MISIVDRKKQKNQEVNPEFPGAPLWDQWLNEQRKLKKKEVGTVRRLGRGALEMAAATVIATDQVRKKLSSERLEINIDRQEKIPSAIETVDKLQKRMEQRRGSRLRRLGSGVLKAANVINHTRKEVVGVTVDHLQVRERKLQKEHRGPITATAYRYAQKIGKKRMNRHIERQGQFEAEKQQAWDKYLDDNPKVRERLEREQQQRDEQHEIDSQYGAYTNMARRAGSAVEYLSEGNVYSFSKSLPRRPEFSGSYDELATSSIEHASASRKEDNSIPLFGKAQLESIVEEKLPLSPPGTERNMAAALYSEEGPIYRSQGFHNRQKKMIEERKDGTDYVSGINTALWKMGFVEYDTEEQIPYGSGRMSPDVQWDREGDITHAQLPYDPANELHQIILGEGRDLPENPVLQLSINNDRSSLSPELSVGVVPSPVRAEAVPA